MTSPIRSIAGACMLFTMAGGCAPVRQVPQRLPAPPASTPDWRASFDQARTTVGLPSFFETNVGQSDPRVRFLLRRPEYALFLTDQEAVFALNTPPRRPGPSGPARTANAAGPVPQPATLRMALAGARVRTPAGDQRLGAIVKDLRRATPASDVAIPSYGEIQYSDVYPGIDLVFRTQAGALSYDFYLAPQADPRRIQLRFSGVRSQRLDTDGNLILDTSAGVVTHTAPRLYQVINGRRVDVRGGFVLAASGDVGFTVGTRDPSAPLVIDPTIVFASYLGGSGTEYGIGVSTVSVSARDASHVFVVGSTSSVDFPSATSPLSGTWDAFVVRYDLAANPPRLEWATFLGGTWDDFGSDGAASADGGIYVVGASASGSFRGTPGSYLQDTGPANNIRPFIAKLTEGGGVQLATLFPSGFLQAIAIDEVGGSGFSPGVYVVGNAGVNGLATPGVYQGSVVGLSDVIVGKFDLQLSALTYLTYFGGASYDNGADIAVSNGSAYIVGLTGSRDFQFGPGVLQPSPGATTPGDCVPDPANCWDGLAAAFDRNGAQLIFGTYLGGPASDGLNGVAIDGAGRATAVGFTGYVNVPGRTTQLVVARLEANGSGHTVTFGGSSMDVGTAVAVDRFGRTFIAGSTDSPGLGTADAPQPSYGGTGDAFFAAINRNDQLTFYTYLGGYGIDFGFAVAIDRGDSVYMAGVTWPVAPSDAVGFPIVNATQPSPSPGGSSGNYDAFVVRFANPPPVFSLEMLKSDNPDPATVGQPLTYTILITNTGEIDGSGATFTDPLPPNVTFQSALPPSCTFNGSTRVVSCPLGTITSTGAFVAITVIPNAAGQVCNEATLTVSQRPQPLVAQQCTTVNPPPPPATPNVFVTMEALDFLTLQPLTSPLFENDPIRIRLTARNDGSAPASNVTVTLSLPGGCSFLDPATTAASVSWTLPDALAPPGLPGDRTTRGASVRCAAAGNYVSAATIAASNEPAPQSSDGNAATMTMAVNIRPRVLVEIVWSPADPRVGRGVVAALLVRNVGTVTADNIQANATFTTGNRMSPVGMQVGMDSTCSATDLTAPVITFDCATGSLGVNQQRVIVVFGGPAVALGDVRVSAGVTAQNSRAAGAASGTRIAGVSQASLVPTIGDATSPAAGRYTVPVTIHNYIGAASQGASPAQSIHVTLSVTGNVTLTSAMGDNLVGACTPTQPNRIECDIASLPAERQAVIQLNFASAAPGSVVVEAIVSTVVTDDQNTADNTATRPVVFGP